MSLRVVPVRFRHARSFIADWHRHNGLPQGALFCLGAADEDGVLHGIATVGRPLARLWDNCQTAEVTRCCTDGSPNACSMLYGAAWRACKAMGYTRLITYTRRAEGGVSLRAAGWRVVAERPPHPGWSRPSRPRGLNGTEGDELLLWEAS
jgi:hypothetical protein